jgi:large conductance mechanosensitive channel
VSRLSETLKQFRDFALRGNVVELAVAIVIGTAFTQLVQVFVASFVSPLISMFAGRTGLVDLRFSINSAEFLYGAFLQAVITFMTIAAVVFFLVVKPMNFLMARVRRGEEPASEAPAEDVVLLREIRDLLREGRAV